jgi:hypothetical protein
VVTNEGERDGVTGKHSANRCVGWVLALALALLAAGCSSGREAGDVDTVYGKPASPQLELGINSCNQNPNAEVQEDDQEIRLSITVDETGSSHDDCMDGLNVTLAKPLGDRTVIVNGTVFLVTPSEES